MIRKSVGSVGLVATSESGRLNHARAKERAASRATRRTRFCESRPSEAKAQAVQRPLLRSSRITNHGSRGFTLIELLVVVVILSVVIGAVLLRVDAGPERELQRDAERLAALIQLGCERAERVGRDLGLSVDGQGYRFGWILPQGFVPIASDSGEALRERSWERPLSLRMEREGRVQAMAESNRAPHIGCSSRGELTAFRIELRAPDGDEAWQVAGGAGRRAEASRVGG